MKIDVFGYTMNFSSHIVIVYCMAAIAACANTPSRGARGPEFDVLTSQGPVSVHVQGTATGFANADPSRLIRSAMAEVYPIRWGMPLDTSSTKQILVWNVTKDGRLNYVVSGRLVRGGEVIKSTWTDVIGLEAAPYGVFMRTISLLALSLLPPATETRARLMSDCS
jgi:hypothetical protein